MKSFLHLIMMSLIALWLGAIALFSIQNVAPVSLKFLGFASIQLPIGVMLSFCVGGGLILGAIVPLLLPSPRVRRDRQDDRDAFDFD
jgi:uncharacterized integral membrane protein